LTLPNLSHQDSVSSDGTSKQKTKEFGFSKHQRLLDSKAYSHVFSDAPLRASHPSLLILARLNDLGVPRIGLVVPKKHVRRAHQRNLIKRVARETFRKEQHKLPPIDAIVLARRGADIISKQELTLIFIGLWKRISKRAPAPTP
jgi:ribonuclease P protein component